MPKKDEINRRIRFLRKKLNAAFELPNHELSLVFTKQREVLRLLAKLSDTVRQVPSDLPNAKRQDPPSPCLIIESLWPDDFLASLSDKEPTK